MLPTPLTTVAQAALQPYVRLAQSNAALLAEFWLARPTLTLPFPEVQRPLFSARGAAPASSSEWPGEALAQLWRGLIDNQFRFVSELMQGAPALFGAVAAPHGPTPQLPVPR